MLVRTICLVVTAVFCLPVLSPSYLSASDVEVDIQRATSASELVFEGRVTAREARFTPDRSAIHTYVTFEVLDVIKGTYIGKSINLSYLGGTVGTVSLDVGDVKAPNVGERGIYFVESLNRRLVHPLYGGDQGHFIIRNNASSGREEVTARNGQKVVGFSGEKADSSQLSRGLPAGLRYESVSSAKAGMSAAEFKRDIKQLLRPSVQ